MRRAIAGGDRRARALLRAGVAVLAVDLLESVVLTLPSVRQDPLGAPVGVAEIWMTSAVIAALLLGLLGLLHVVRRTRWYVWLAGLPFAAVVFGCFVLLWTGHPLSLLVDFFVFGALLFVPEHEHESLDA